MDAPPELLAWARETANGITRLVRLVLDLEIEMIQLEWVPPQRDDAVG